MCSFSKIAYFIALISLTCTVVSSGAQVKDLSPNDAATRASDVAKAMDEGYRYVIVEATDQKWLNRGRIEVTESLNSYRSGDHFLSDSTIQESSDASYGAAGERVVFGGNPSRRFQLHRPAESSEFMIQSFGGDLGFWSSASSRSPVILAPFLFYGYPLSDYLTNNLNKEEYIVTVKEVHTTSVGSHPVYKLVTFLETPSPGVPEQTNTVRHDLYFDAETWLLRRTDSYFQLEKAEGPFRTVVIEYGDGAFPPPVSSVTMTAVSMGPDRKELPLRSINVNSFVFEQPDAAQFTTTAFGVKEPASRLARSTTSGTSGNWLQNKYVLATLLVLIALIAGIIAFGLRRKQAS